MWATLKTTGWTAWGSFSCGSNQTYFSPWWLLQETVTRAANSTNLTFCCLLVLVLLLAMAPALPSNVTLFAVPGLLWTCLRLGPKPRDFSLGLKLAWNGTPRVFWIWLWKLLDPESHVVPRRKRCIYIRNLSFCLAEKFRYHPKWSLTSTFPPTGPSPAKGTFPPPPTSGGHFFGHFIGFSKRGFIQNLPIPT